MKASARPTVGNLDPDAPRTRKEAAARKIPALVPLIGLAAMLYLGSVSSWAATVTFGSDNDGLGGFTTSTVLGGESWSTEAESVQYRSEDPGTLNSSLLKQYPLDRSPGSSYKITGVVTMTDGYADDNNRLGMYLFGDSDIVPDQNEAGAVGIIFNTDDSVTSGPPGSNARDYLSLRESIDGSEISPPELRNQTPTPFAQDLFGTTMTFETTITFVGANIEIVAKMTDQDGALTTASAIVPAADYTGDYFGFVNRARARNYPDTAANRGAPWVMDYRSFSLEPVSSSTVIFGSDNDGLGEFTTSTVLGAESWSTEPGSVQYRCEDPGTLNSSLLRWYPLDRSPGSSYTITGVVTMTDGYADDNNRLGMYLFGDSDVVPDQNEAGAVGIIFNTDDSVTSGPPGSNARDYLSLRAGIDGGELSPTELRNQTPTPFAQDLFGTTITFETTITFVGANIEIVAKMTDQDGALTTASAIVPAADYTGDYFGFVNRARARNYPDTPANRGAPWVMDYRSFSIEPPPVLPPGSTVFNNADPANNYISTPGNWTNGLPVGQQGTIGADAGYDSTLSHDGYDILQTAGTVGRSNSFMGLKLGPGSVWVVDGPTAQITRTRGIGMTDAQFTLKQGIADLTDNGSDSNVGGTSVLTITGGDMSIGRNLLLAGGDIVVEGGSLSVNAHLGSRNFHPGGNLILNGGTTSAQYLTFGTAALDLTFGGSTGGSLTIENFDGNRHNASAIGIDFLAGTMMSMTLTDPVESGNNGDGDIGWSEVGSETGLSWAQTLWEDGRLTYNGQDYTTLGPWADVSSPAIGLGGGYYWDYDDQANTLSVAVFVGPDPDISTVTASPASVVADGAETSTITVTLKTAGGDPVEGKDVTLENTSGPGMAVIAPAGPVATDANGVATFTVSSTTVGTEVFTATDVTDGVVITQTASVEFTIVPQTWGLGIGGPPPNPDAPQTSLVAGTTPAPTRSPDLVEPEVVTAEETPEYAPTENVIRVTEYALTAGDFSGTTTSVILDQALASDYFILVRGSRAGDGRSMPDNDYVRVVSVPGGRGGLADSGAAEAVGLQRAAAEADWEGVITVVECLAPANPAGFKLVDAVVTDLSGPAGSAVCAPWDDTDQVVPFGGYRGGGVELAEIPDSRYAGTSAYVRLNPGSNGTLNWERDGGGERLLDATMTTFVVEWGNEWTVQHAALAGTSGGGGADETGEYTTATIAPVTRANTWVWGTGVRADAGIGDCAESCLVTLGDGVTVNATESSVAVGSEYSDAYSFDVYALTHPGLAVDHRFKPDGDRDALDLPVPVNAAPAGARFGWVYNGCSGTSSRFPRPRFWSRYTADDTVTLSRGYDGADFPAWIQGIDFSGMNLE